MNHPCANRQAVLGRCPIVEKRCFERCVQQCHIRSGAAPDDPGLGRDEGAIEVIDHKGVASRLGTLEHMIGGKKVSVGGDRSGRAAIHILVLIDIRQMPAAPIADARVPGHHHSADPLGNDLTREGVWSTQRRYRRRASDSQQSCQHNQAVCSRTCHPLENKPHSRRRVTSELPFPATYPPLCVILWRNSRAWMPHPPRSIAINYPIRARPGPWRWPNPRPARPCQIDST